MRRRLYGIANFRGTQRRVRTDVQTPGYMRAPHEHPASFAIECAVDELAYALGKDPVALRLANDTQTDPITGKPFSSRHLAECLQPWRAALRLGAPSDGAAFDARAGRQPRRLGRRDRRLQGSHCAGRGKLRLSADGRVRLAVGGHEMGQGIRTAIAARGGARARRAAGGDRDRHRRHAGRAAAPDRRLLGHGDGLPPARGSRGAADGRPAPAGRRQQRHRAALLRASGRPFAEAESRQRAPGQPEQIYGRLTGGLPAAGGPVYPDYVAYSFIAHFVEVRVEPTTRRIRVPRVVSIADCGRWPARARRAARSRAVWSGASARRCAR